MEEDHSSSVGSLHRLKAVTPLSKYLAMILFIFLPFIGGWIGYTHAPAKIVEVEHVVLREVEVNQAKLIGNKAELIKYTSPTGKYTFAVINSGWGTCPYVLLDGNGLGVSVPFITADTVLCGYSDPGGPFDGFEGWTGEDSFIFSPAPAAQNILAPSIVHEIDLAEHTEIIHKPPHGYLYSAHNQEHGYWLYQTGPEGAFVILDSELNVLKEVDGYFKVALYDTVNDGLVLLGKKENSDRQSLSVAFVDFDTLETQSIFETEPVQVSGRGCLGWGTLHSVVGEVRLEPGSCISQNVAEYVDPVDGLIHIKL